KALDLLAVGVEAGLTMDRAMHLYAQESEGALAYEFGIADREMNTLGFSRAEALQRMGERCAVDELSLFVGAVNASAAAGSPIAEVLRNQSEAAFERRRQHFEEQGNKLTSKMILPMGAFLVPAVLVAAIAPMIINISVTASGVI
ncbi:MAG: type II secretion system F family protein, partial [Raoultibacter sp.]